ncbi:MAG: polyprenyl synthetase family protein, partial [Bacteroidetes bacterium]|nr:polyprenyl synthetase family protein [Bacteroidota bacterium]
VTEEVYYDIVRQKTASLIASCCATGASSVSADQESIEKMRLFGEKVGMAFQIKDDLFDYGTREIGKPVGIDIKEKKLTLPLIHALQSATWSERRRIINIINEIILTCTIGSSKIPIIKAIENFIMAKSFICNI